MRFTEERGTVGHMKVPRSESSVTGIVLVRSLWVLVERDVGGMRRSKTLLRWLETGHLAWGRGWREDGLVLRYVLR